MTHCGPRRTSFLTSQRRQDRPILFTRSALGKCCSHALRTPSCSQRGLTGRPNPLKSNNLAMQQAPDCSYVTQANQQSKNMLTTITHSNQHRQTPYSAGWCKPISKSTGTNDRKSRLSRCRKFLNFVFPPTSKIFAYKAPESSWGHACTACTTASAIPA